MGADYKWEHDVSKPLIHLSTKFPKYGKDFSRIAWISSRWIGANQQTRLLASYGNQDAAVPATVFINRGDVELVKNDAEEVCRILNLFETKQKLETPRKIGILNGYVEGQDSTEKPCSKYYYTDFKIEDWEKRFLQFSNSEGKNKYLVEKISISKVGNEYAVIINPFGEVYPEMDVKKRFAFNHLKEYVEDGGILVNVAGFPFFYAWDVIKGLETPIVDEKMLVPESVRIEGEKLYVDRFRPLLNFAGSLSWRDLGIITTADTRDMSGSNQLDVYQDNADKEVVGDIVNLGGENKVFEFRAVRKDATEEVIPLLRAKRPDFGEIYPIAAIKRGFGYVLAGGMHTKTSSEFEKLTVAIDKFCDWIFKNCS